MVKQYGIKEFQNLIVIILKVQNLSRVAVWW